MTDGQQITYATYEDPEIVEGYIQRNALQPKQETLAKQFAKTIPGKKLLDLGCGPGHDAYIFAELGFEVTGLDYSKEMIRRAQDFKHTSHPPTFKVGDIRQVEKYFAENSFDAIWASASLLHIPTNDVPATLRGMTYICKSGAKIYVGLKGGTGTQLVTEDKLGKTSQREFILWTKDRFLAATEPFHWQLDAFSSREGSLFMGKPTQWLNFFFTVEK